jgi:8-oxo-dGTP pyrophosphatase MutT (NUDIX family)
VIDKLAWIHIRDGRMLAARSRGRDVWFVPGGKRESGESDEQALMREIEEELTVTLDRDSLQFLHVFEAQAHGKPEGEFVRMTCFTGDYSGQLQPSAEIEEIAWLTHADRDRMSLVTQNIADWLRDRGELQ